MLVLRSAEGRCLWAYALDLPVVCQQISLTSTIESNAAEARRLAETLTRATSDIAAMQVRTQAAGGQQQYDMRVWDSV